MAFKPSLISHTTSLNVPSYLRGGMDPGVGFAGPQRGAVPVPETLRLLPEVTKVSKSKPKKRSRHVPIGKLGFGTAVGLFCDFVPNVYRNQDFLT